MVRGPVQIALCTAPVLMDKLNARLWCVETMQSVRLRMVYQAATAKMDSSSKMESVSEVNGECYLYYVALTYGIKHALCLFSCVF